MVWRERFARKHLLDGGLMLKRRVGNVSKKGRLTKRGVEKNIGRFVFFVCLSIWVSFTNIHDSQDRSGRGRLFL